MKRLVALLLLSLSVPLSAAEEAAAPKSGCDAFTWDVSHELAVLGQAAKPLNAGRDAKSSVRAQLDTHYVVKLAPQGDVRFAAKLGKPMLDDGAQGGLLTFHTATPGRYRVAITTGHWLDVVDGGNVVVSRDFQGQRGCERVHKIVEFELSGNRDFVLQLSGGTAESVGVAITQVKKPA